MNELSPVLNSPGTIFELPTPALVLDGSRLLANAERMREKVKSLGVALRPHVKTSKSIDVLRVLSGGGEIPITVSTLPCATAAAYDRYFVTEGDRRIADVWERVNGW